MTAIEIVAPGGGTKKLIVRLPSQAALELNPLAAQDEFRLLQIGQEMDLATPAPVHLDQSGELFPTPYLVIEYIEGKLQFAPRDRASHVRQMATHLARIHSADCAMWDLAFLPIRRGGCAEMRADRPTPLNASLQEQDVREALASTEPLPPRNVRTLLHGDFWPGNTLWLDDKLVAVIDWEDATLGDPLIDLAISRLDIGWIFGIDAMHTFTEHYQSLMDIDYQNLAYWDLCAALRLIRLAGSNLSDWVAFFPPFGRPDITEQTLRSDYAYFTTQALANLAA
jgi:aminoglycoside phosphotransferase (APT) family kinase protein